MTTAKEFFDKLFPHHSILLPESFHFAQSATISDGPNLEALLKQFGENVESVFTLSHNNENVQVMICLNTLGHNCSASRHWNFTADHNISGVYDVIAKTGTIRMK